MATVIPKQPKKERDQITIRLDRDVLQDSGALLPVSGIQPRLRHQPVPHIHLSQRQSVCAVACAARGSPSSPTCPAPLRNQPESHQSVRLRMVRVQGRLSIAE